MRKEERKKERETEREREGHERKDPTLTVRVSRAARGFFQDDCRII